MKYLIRAITWMVLLCAATAQENVVPDPDPPSEKRSPAVHESTATPGALQQWEDWVLWNDKSIKAPPVFDNAGQRIALWPSKLAIEANPGQGKFTISVQVFAPVWMALPGSAEVWPQQVQVNGKPAVVVQRDGRPATKLEPGLHQVSGSLPWETIPQRLAIPLEIGILELSMNGTPITVPNWDASGFLWLKRNRADQEAQREFLESKIYRVLEDGIPMWLRTEIELSVAGKSREEDLGHALPEGWKVASVESRLPVAVEDSGRVRVQARAGKWNIRIDAFRTTAAATISFPDGITPIAKQEIIAFQAKPDFRLVELRDIQAIDVSQTTFPEKWRKLPVYRWDTSRPFHLDEKMRGMGFQKPSGLQVNREFWLDDDGSLMTFRDKINGESQQVWRLDASPGQTLGAARMDGEGQLITKNPLNGASGIEVRQRKIDLEAVGRISNARNFPASGWQADVDKCEATLHLPPGWRVLALFGAEWVRGDWLTNWTLLDLFLLLVFTIAVGKLWGWLPAVIALLGFGLTFHEPGAPKATWFVLLVPLAILRMGLTGKPRIFAEAGKYIAIGVLLVILVPFVGRQIQGVLYPQLEPGVSVNRASYGPRQSSDYGNWSISSGKVLKRSSKEVANLKQDVEARIQTGPAIPSWTWRNVRFGWRGPVTESEMVNVILIPPSIQRGITILRILLLILLVAVLLGANRLLPRFLRRKPASPPNLPGTAKSAIVIALFFLPNLLPAQENAFPPDALLKELRQRLIEPSDAFPGAADIPQVKLSVGKSTLKMEAEIHAAARTAVPLPGKLPSWSPLTVTINGNPARAVARKDNYLWIVLDPGTHQVTVEGLLPNSTEWAWSFLLEPRRVAVDAPSWTVTGIKANGVPEKQVFFALKSPAASAEAAYDRKDFTPAVAVERSLELGLIWQLRTTLTRLSPGGKAAAFSIPLLPGERVLSSHFTVKDGEVQARLGADQNTVSWESELPQADSITLTSSETAPWVERWKLIASPVWNVAFEGLSPVYEPGAGNLEPVWRPWPGETATLLLSKPEAVPGATMTVRAVQHTTRIGSRQRVSQLRLNLQASLGQDFVLDLDPDADVTSLKIGDAKNPKGVAQPVRRDQSSVIIPVHPGEQIIDLEWKAHRTISSREVVDLLELPVESSNIDTTLTLPGDRWVLWASGPLRGPAVRLWSFVLLALVVAFVLGRLRSSPLRGGEWGLLVLGLTQVHPVAALGVICWFFLIAWRGSDRGVSLRPASFNLTQVAIVLLAIPVVATIVFAMHRGLLGVPQMMVQGNQSTYTSLRWFAQRTDSTLPVAGVISVSIWFYRLFMLAWALWLAISAIRWVRWGWEQFTRKTLWKTSPRKVVEK